MKHLFRLCLLMILSAINPLANAAEGQLLNVPLPELPENQEVLRLKLFAETYSTKSQDMLYLIFVKYAPSR